MSVFRLPRSLVARLWHGLRCHPGPVEGWRVTDGRFRKCTRHRVSEQRIDACRRVFLQRLDCVEVNARRDRRRFMPERARDGLQIDARRQRQRPERVAQVVKPNLREFRALDEPRKCERERAGLPRRAVGAREDPIFRVVPRRELASSFLLMRLRRTSATNGGSAIVRALRAVFGGFVRVTPLTVSSERRTVSRRASRSTSDHRSASSSPRRNPVPIATATIACSSLPCAARNRRATPAASSTRISLRSKRGGSTASAAFRTSSPILTPQRRIVRSVLKRCATVRDDSVPLSRSLRLPCDHAASRSFDVCGPQRLCAQRSERRHDVEPDVRCVECVRLGGDAMFFGREPSLREFGDR